MQTISDNYGLDLFSKEYLNIEINEDNDTYMYDREKVKIGNKFPHDFLVFNPSFYI